MNMFEVSWKSDRRASETFCVGHASAVAARPGGGVLRALGKLGSWVGKSVGELVGWLVGCHKYRLDVGQ